MAQLSIQSGRMFRKEGVEADDLLCSRIPHPAHGRGVSPVAKIIAMGSGSNKFCLVLLGA
jgi:hypothetical protein